MSKIDVIDGLVKDAMKSGDTERRDVLRLVLNALKQSSKDLQRDLSESEELEILAREAKKRREAIASFRAGGREDQALAEEYELGVIEEFLPAALGEDEVIALIRSLIASEGLSGLHDKGRMMKVLMPQLKGVFDGRRAGELVDVCLGELSEA